MLASNMQEAASKRIFVDVSKKAVCRGLFVCFCCGYHAHMHLKAATIL